MTCVKKLVSIHARVEPAELARGGRQGSSDGKRTMVAGRPGYDAK
jgi:hypothetical protein